MPGPGEKEPKKSTFLKDVRDAAIVTILLLAYVRGHDIRMAEEQNKSNPNPSISTCNTPTPENGKSVVVYQSPSPNSK